MFSSSGLTRDGLVILFSDSSLSFFGKLFTMRFDFDLTSSGRSGFRSWLELEPPILPVLHKALSKTWVLLVYYEPPPAGPLFLVLYELFAFMSKLLKFCGRSKLLKSGESLC